MRNRKKINQTGNKKAIKLFVILLSVFMLASAMTLTGNTAYVEEVEVALAVNADGSTDLESNQGLVIGQNRVRTTQQDFRQIGAATSRTHYPVRNNTQQPVNHLRANETQSDSNFMGIFDPGVTSNSVEFVTRININPTLLQYINDPNIRVTAQAVVEVLLHTFGIVDTDSSDNCKIMLRWYPRGTSSASNEIKVATVNHVTPGGTSVSAPVGDVNTWVLEPGPSHLANSSAYLEIRIYDFKANSNGHNNPFPWVGVEHWTAGIGMIFRNIRVNVNANIISPSVATPNSFEISGFNRIDPSVYNNVSESDLIYVKTGDEIFMNSQLYSFGSIVNDNSMLNVRGVYNISQSNTVIEWKEGTPSGASSASNIDGYFSPGSRMVRYNTPTDFSSYNPSVSYSLNQYVYYEGRVYRYINATPASGRTPSTNTSHWTIDQTRTNYVLGKNAKFQVLGGNDDPILVMTYLPIGNNNTVSGKQTFYVDNSAPNNPILNDASLFKQMIDQGRYFTRFNDQGTRVIQDINNFNNSGVPIFHPSAFQKQGGADEYIYYTIGNYEPNPNDTVNTKLLYNGKTGQFFPLDLSGLGSGVVDNGKVNFKTFDGAGNFSETVSYTIKIDFNNYVVNTSFGLGTFEAPSSAAIVRPYAGIKFYKNGILFNPGHSGNPGSYTYNRDDIVEIWIEQNQAQYDNYRLNYYIGGDSPTRNFNVEMVPNINNIYQFKLTYEISNQIDLQNLAVKFFFKKKAEIAVNTTQRTYTGQALKPSSIFITAYDEGGVLESGVTFETYVKQQHEPASAFSLDGFVNAGVYDYRCVIVSNKYFGVLEGTYEILKRDPDVREVTANILTYGESFSDLIIRSMNNQNVLSETESYLGVPGAFSIINPLPTSSVYLSPNVGTHSIIVKFTPAAPGPAYDPNDPRKNAGACRINYIEVTRTINVTVLHQSVSVSFVESTFNAVFDGFAKSISVITATPTPQPVLIEYKLASADESFFSTQQPINAGIYDVRATILEAQSNYRGAVDTLDMPLKLVIEKREIDVLVTENNQEITKIEAYYGHFYKPSYSSVPESLKTGINLEERDIYGLGGEIRVPVAVIYEYRLQGSQDYVEFAASGYQKLPVGLYDFRITINNNNNKGYIVYPLEIKKGSLSYGDTTSLYSITFPGVTYFQNIGGHITYGQRLSQAALTPGQGYRATYRLHDGTFEIIPGRFELLENLSDPVLEAKSTPYTRFLAFIPNDLHNFDIISIPTNIIVGRARPLFDGLTLDRITYGQTIGDAGLSQDYATFIKDGVLTQIPGTYTYIGDVNATPNAGLLMCQYTFTPSEDALLYLQGTVATLPLYIDKADVTDIYFPDDDITMVYGSAFTPPVVITNPAGLTVNLTYYSGDNLVNINTQTPVGVYTIIATVNNVNYKGSTSSTITITPATLVTATMPSHVIFRYNMTLGDIVLYDGNCLHQVPGSPGRIITGSFRFEDTTIKPSEIGVFEYRMIFTPDSNLYGQNYYELEFDYSLTVNKALCTVSMNPQSLNVVYNGEAKVPQASAIDVGGQPLNIVFSYVDSYGNPISEAINAGTYQVTATIVDDYYTGQLTQTLVIAKAQAVISVEQENRTANYTGQPIDIIAFTQPAGLNYNATYRNNNNHIADALQVGLYSATVTIDDQNYQGSFTVSFLIKEGNFSFVGYDEEIVQTYGEVTPVTIDVFPQGLNHTITYKPATAPDSAYSQVVPVLAGLYNVRVVFEQSGYVGTYVYDMVIQKAQAGIISDQYIQRVYTNTLRNIPASTNPSNLNLVFEYAVINNGVIGDYSLTQPRDVGLYSLKISINDTNYQGEKILEYEIVPGDIEIIISPIAISSVNDAGRIYYSDPNSSIIFTSGTISFVPNVANPVSQIITDGQYSFITDISKLPAGIHNLGYVFEPTSKNFNPVYGSLYITIQRKDISNLLRFEEADIRQSYNSKNLSVGAYVDDPAIASVIHNIVVLYNNNRHSPTNVGVYELTAVIEDANYQGEKRSVAGSHFEIIRGIPSIVNPILNPIYIGQPLSASTISLGYAYIEGTDIRIPGRFSFDAPSTVMTRANLRNVNILFTPDATNNFFYRTFVMQIMVLGENPVLASKSATALTYGNTLSQSSLNVSYDVPGYATWVNPNYIPNVGDIVSYVFTPDDYDNYNVVYDTIEIQVSKAILDVSNVVGIGFVGNTFNSISIQGNLVNTINSSAPVTGSFELLSVTGYNVNDEIDATYQNLQGTVRFTSANYETVVTNITIKTYKLINDNIQIRKTVKTYDGNPLTPEDFDILISGTDHSIYSNSLIFTYKRNGVEITHAETATVGVYTVEVKINDPIYYGSKQFVYVINKINVTDSISYEGETTVFGSVVAPTISFGGYNITESDYQISYRRITSSNFDYALPLTAGQFVARVVVSSANYEGTITFLYTIEKAEVEIFCDNMVQNYGAVVSPMPLFSTNIGEGNYVITYDGSLVMPIDAGNYQAKITIEHSNFKGERTISFIINKAVSQLDVAPVLSDLRFGQGLVDIVITGGIVRHSYTTVIEGSFRAISVLNVTGNLIVGENTVIIRFTPKNNNYTTIDFPMTIIVHKAIATISYSDLELEYDGQEKSPSFIVMPNNSINVRVTYAQGGVILTSPPINAGVYTITVTVNDLNYEGSRTSSFTIKKAKAKIVELPTASDLVYMEAVRNSNFTGGSMIYILGGNPVPGTYKFAQEGTVLGKAGVVYSVPFIFTPLDTSNYDSYQGMINVRVIKKVAIINVSNNNLVYGSTLENIAFSTNPIGLNVVHNISDITSIMDAGSYTFTADIIDENYRGKLTFNVIIVKRELTLTYYMNNVKTDIVTNGYAYTYNSALNARAFVNGLIAKDLINETKINNQLVYEYYSPNKNTYYGLIAPKNVGDYIVIGTLNHNNYFIKETNATQTYRINRAAVNGVTFNTGSLNSQIYGDVQAPIMTTSPHDVKMQLSYIGYDAMPKNAGIYTIHVVSIDNNYMPYETFVTFRILPRTLNIVNIKVDDKVFNNTATLSIRGDLQGVLIGDEVNLTMTARVQNSKTEVGYHNVEITSYNLIGMHASNYTVVPPSYTRQVRITENKITDQSGGAYVTGPQGFSDNTTVSVSTVDSVLNRSGFLSALTGQERTVQSFTIKEGDENVQLDGMVKVFIKIPDRYLNAENLEVIALGDLANSNITFTREGDYITFYTNATGEIMFTNTKAPVTAMLFVSSGLVIVLGTLFIFFMNPVKRRRRVTAEKARYMR